jgi:Ricin-type beta-trefoil lectin domain
MKLILKLLIISFGFIISCSSTIANAQNSNEFLMPFRYNEQWETMEINGRDNYGIHQDRTGFAIDFYSPSITSFDVLSPTNGNFSISCSVRNQASINFTSDTGVKFRFIHMNKSSLNIVEGQSKRVARGDYIGKLYTGIGNYNTSSCSLSLEAPQLHFSWEPQYCPFSIEGYTFECNGMYTCPGTYKVPCNKKNLNVRFISTNKEGLSDDICKSLFTRPWSLNQTSEDALNLQICLRRFNNTEFGYNFSGKISNFDLNQLRIVKNVINGVVINSTTKPNLLLEVKGNINVDGQRVWLNDNKNIQTTKFVYDKTTQNIYWKDKCLDAGNGILGEELRVYACHQGLNQKWKYDKSNRLVSLSNNLCIDAKNGLVAGSFMYIHNCHDKENQKWVNNLGIEPSENVIYKALNQNLISTIKNQGLSLTVNNGENFINNQVLLKVNNSSDAQQFSYDPISENIRWRDKCLDGGNGTLAQELRIYPCHTGLNQKWRIDSSNRIINQTNKLCLDARNGLTNHSPVYIHFCHDKDNQKWSNRIELKIDDTTTIPAESKVNYIPSLINSDIVMSIKNNQNIEQNRVILNSLSISQFGNKNNIFTYEPKEKTIKWIDKCLDAGNGILNDELRINSCNGGTNQKWYFDSSKRLVSMRGGYCVDNKSGIVDNSILFISTCNNLNSQQFKNLIGM